MSPAVLLLIAAQVVAPSVPSVSTSTAWQDAWRMEREARIHWQTSALVYQKWNQEKTVRLSARAEEVRLLEGIIAEGQKKPPPEPEIVPWWGWTALAAVLIGGFAGGFVVGLAN